MLTLVVYAPGAGGNHLKNLLCLSSHYANAADLDPAVYKRPDPERPPGEVWCVGGRNLQPVFFERMIDCNQSWVLAAHAGEMFEYWQQLSTVKNKKIIVVSLDNAAARRQLDQRQIRLGQCIHPYWLDEELQPLYQADTLAHLFDFSVDDCYTLPLENFWSRSFVADKFQQIKQFLNIDIDNVAADEYHQLWCTANSFE